MYEVVRSPVTLPDIHSVFFFSFFSQEAVLFFSHLASFHHSFSQDWQISTEAEACHTFADLHPEDDMIEMISNSVSTHLAVLHSVPVLSSGIYRNTEMSACMLGSVPLCGLSALCKYNTNIHELMCKKDDEQLHQNVMHAH